MTNRGALLHLTGCFPTRLARLGLIAAAMADNENGHGEGAGHKGGVSDRPAQLYSKLSSAALSVADNAAQNQSACELSDAVAHAIGDLTWRYAEQLSCDIALYAKHRGSTFVSEADVWLAGELCPCYGPLPLPWMILTLILLISQQRGAQGCTRGSRRS